MALSSPNELQAEAKEFIVQWDKLSFKRTINEDSAASEEPHVEIDAVYSVFETVFLFKLAVNITRPSASYEFALLVGYEYEFEIAPSHQESIQLIVEKLGPLAFEILNREIAHLDSYSIESTVRISMGDQVKFWDYFRNRTEDEAAIRARGTK